MTHRLLLPLGLLALGLATQGCAALGGEEDETASSNDELAVDRTPLPTTHATLRAGDPYSPVLDERPLVIGDNASCLKSPVVEITPGTTEVEASIVASRRDLFHRLDLGVDGVPINVRALQGATGTARLAIESKVGNGSLTLMFQAKGTFESTLRGVAEEPPAFDAKKVGTCGWGYVKKAYHRLSAVVMVTVESTDSSNSVRLGCAAGATDCTPTGVTAGPVSVKLALERMLKEGSYNISLRSVSDAISDLAAAPFGDMVAMSSTPDSAAVVMEKLSKSLDWLGTAQKTISDQITKNQSEPASSVRAPTMKVDFQYYPGITSAQKDRLAQSYDEVVALRNDYELTLSRASVWENWRDARDQGLGHVYNTPASLSKTVEEMGTRSEELLGDNGLLRLRRNELESGLGRCEDAARATADTLDALVSRVATDCKRLAKASWDSGYDKRYDLKRLAPTSVGVRKYDEWGDNMCPPGQRIANKDEAAILEPWSHVTAREQDKGIWIRREMAIRNPIWIKAGNVERAGMFSAPEHVNVCFADGKPLFE